MAKKKHKNSRKLKLKRIEAANKERRERKKLREQDALELPSPIGFSLVLKRNALPMTVLICGCLVFYFSNNFDTRLAGAFFKPVYSPKVLAAEASPADFSKLMPEKASEKEKALSFSLLPQEHISLVSIPVLEPVFEAPKLDSFVAIGQEKVRVSVKKKDKEEKEGSIRPELKIAPAKIEKPKASTPIASVPLPIASEHYETELASIIKGKPMEAMLDDILKRDRAVAAFLLGIGMKESKYGIYSPKKDGRDCYNYWGYRGRENPTRSGYSCFDSPEQAVRIVGDRIERLIQSGHDTPAKMIVWKCGSSCAGHSEESVNKWIADVSINYYRLNSAKLVAKN
jgi:hypothetical protein